MTLGEYLKDKFGCNEPIYISEIRFKDYSRSWIFSQLKKLVESGEIKRFDRGIYYFSVKTLFGDSLLDPYKVLVRRFLSDGNNIYGYFAGAYLLNRTGLSTQVPALIELVSNNEKTRVRDIEIGKTRIRVRRSRTTVTKENITTLQFLDLMNSVTLASMDETKKFMLRRYIKESGVTRNAVTQYANLFPTKVMENIIESGIAYELI